MGTKRVWVILAAVVTVMLVLASGVDFRSSVNAQSLLQSTGGSWITIPYAGQLHAANGGPAANGIYEFAFALYATDTGGSALWSETQTGVPVQEGAFVALLGAAEPIPPTALANDEGWLSISVRGPGETVQTELAPRQHVSRDSPVTAAGMTACAACAHDHVGEVWNASVAWSNAALKVINTANGPSIWGQNSGAATRCAATATAQVSPSTVKPTPRRRL